MTDVDVRKRLEREFASSFIRIRGAHHPDPGEPCAWCRLAAEQAAEAVVTNEALAALLAVDEELADAAEAVLPEVMQGATILVGIERWARLRAVLNRMGRPR